MSDATGGAAVRRRPDPHLVTTVGELRKVVADLLAQTHFVIDVETTFSGPHANEVLWIGLGSRASVYLIPINHPLGYITVPEHMERRLPPDNERAVLQSGNLSTAKKTYRVPAQYSDRIDQLPASTIFKELKPLLFSDREKIGQNL